MSKKPDIGRVIEFQRLLQAFSHIERVNHRKHHDAFIHENDTEHSYNLALTAWFLCEHFPELDRDKVIRFALVHDLVEVHAGDTYIFADQVHLDSKAEREHVALKQLEADWPDFTELTGCITEYEARSTPEAIFVYALDKIMPMMLTYINDGHTWKQEGMNLGQLHAYKHAKVALSKEIQPYYDQLHQLLLDSPHLIPPR